MLRGKIEPLVLIDVLDFALVDGDPTDFSDDFDRVPSLTNGITSLALGNLFVPFAVNGFIVDVALASNTNPSLEGIPGPVPGGFLGPDEVRVSSLASFEDTGGRFYTNQSFEAFAVFTRTGTVEVAEPASALSLLLGLIGLGTARRLRRGKA